MRLLAFALPIVLACASARAQEPERVVVLSVGGDAPEATARQAREAVARALSEAGLDTVPDADVALRIAPARLRDCRQIACAHAIGRELGASMVAAVAAWHGTNGASSITVSLVRSADQAQSASEDVGEDGWDAAAARALSAARTGQASAAPRRAANPTPRTTPRARRREPARARPAQQERSLEEYVLPTILGVVGLTAVAASVYALIDERCDLRADSGLCLRGDRPNVGVGALLAVTGGLAIAGAITWFIVGGLPPSMGRIDIVLGPDGGGIGWLAAF